MKRSIKTALMAGLLALSVPTQADDAIDNLIRSGKAELGDALLSPDEDPDKTYAIVGFCVEIENLVDWIYVCDYSPSEYMVFYTEDKAMLDHCNELVGIIYREGFIGLFEGMKLKIQYLDDATQGETVFCDFKNGE